MCCGYFVLKSSNFSRLIVRIKFVGLSGYKGEMVMIAEIKHKVINYQEDELTGNFFGNMRYLPFDRGLQIIFTKYCKSNDRAFLNILTEIKKTEFDMNFWKKSMNGHREIDGYIEVGDVGIGIEVKYNSGLSGEEQLEDEAGMVSQWCKSDKKLLLFIAKEESVKQIYLANYKKNIFQKVHLGYISWEDILLGLDDVIVMSRQEELIVKDLKEFLEGRGFLAFQGFEKIVLPVERGQYYEFG